MSPPSSSRTGSSAAAAARSLRARSTNASSAASTTRRSVPAGSKTTAKNSTSTAGCPLGPTPGRFSQRALDRRLGAVLEVTKSDGRDEPTYDTGRHLPGADHAQLSRDASQPLPPQTAAPRLPFRAVARRQLAARVVQARLLRVLGPSTRTSGRQRRRVGRARRPIRARDRRRPLVRRLPARGVPDQRPEPGQQVPEGSASTASPPTRSKS